MYATQPDHIHDDHSVGPGPASQGCVAVTAVIVVLPFVAIGLVGRLLGGVSATVRRGALAPGLVAVPRAFPALCLLTLAPPLAVGWAIGGTWVYGVTALLWPLAPLSYGESRHDLRHGGAGRGRSRLTPTTRSLNAVGRSLS
ncbi:hypothetical protein [Streptomyces canus]|uniref:hypothetical protein n=1 Tax=Streptomyces canus TaxID=58343 RepID=UPI003717D68C